MIALRKPPWSHFPHCPSCSRRLWILQNNEGRDITPPTADMHCPHCGTDLLKGK